MKNQFIRRWIWPVLIILLTGFIWGHSLMNGEQSQKESHILGEWLLSQFGPDFANGFLYQNLRKVAHFGEFALLGVAWGGWQCSLHPRRKFRHLFWLAGPLIAVADELLQFCSVNRSPALTDVLLDTAGFIVGMAFTLLIHFVYYRSRQRKVTT